MSLVVKKGEKITCANGHVVGEALKDLHLGDMNWGDAFGNWVPGITMIAGQSHKPTCPECAAPFIQGNWQLHFEDDTWRP